MTAKKLLPGSQIPQARQPSYPHNPHHPLHQLLCFGTESAGVYQFLELEHLQLAEKIDEGYRHPQAVDQSKAQVVTWEPAVGI